MAREKNRKSFRGFSVIELVITIGIMVIVGALLTPSVARARRAGQQIVSDQRVRSLATGLTAYANDYREYPPVMFPPRFAFYPPESDTATVDGEDIRGLWWNTTTLYIYPLKAYVPVATAFAPRSKHYKPGQEMWLTQGPTDYWLSQAFYATPAFWNRATKVGPEQFGAQRLTDVRYPSQKSLIFQEVSFLFPEYGDVASTLAVGIPCSVGWVDGSAGSESRWMLPKGVPNCWQHSYRESILSDGNPLDETRDGIWGIDRLAAKGR